MISLQLAINHKRFPAATGSPERTLYRDFTLDVAAGTTVALLGPSGLGKTTLLNIVAGLDTDFEGAVRFSPKAPRFGYAFQNPRLLPWRTVLENVLLAAGRGTEARARELLTQAGLGAALEAYPERLSLGQQRRVGLIRALAAEPDVLLLDEPLASLDAQTAARLEAMLARQLEARPATVLLVTHDRTEAGRLARRIVTLDGPPVRIAADDPA
ncbi:MAG TPA: ATP-binding cassette domain-containing protein [Xanthobacteraceae bacterium]|nr:ATP-binding cassette domain-containing protein [Xanthobacteraceae bacterium]